MVIIKGYIQGNTVVTHDETLLQYNGKEVTISIYDTNAGNNPSIDIDSYIIPSERADYSQEYVYDLRKNDRL